MDLNLTGKNALVCGSTQGIGNAIANELALLGANVTLLARNEEKLIAAVKALPKNEDQHHDYLTADFQQADQLRKVVQQATENRIFHILINNTGGPAPGQIIEATSEQFLQAFSAHLICNQLLVQFCVEGMKKEKFGRIINVISSSVKVPIPGLGVSNTIRGAVASWSKTLAGELAPFGITVNNILPGLIRTGRLESLIQSKAKEGGVNEDTVEQKMKSEIPAGRFGDLKEIAAAAAFLASPAASYVNGINFPVDGGKIPSL